MSSFVVESSFWLVLSSCCLEVSSSCLVPASSCCVLSRSLWVLSRSECALSAQISSPTAASASSALTQIHGLRRFFWVAGGGSVVGAVSLMGRG